MTQIRSSFVARIGLLVIFTAPTALAEPLGSQRSGQAGTSGAPGAAGAVADARDGALSDDAPASLFGSPPVGVTTSTAHFQYDDDDCFGLLCDGGCSTSSSMNVSGLADAIWDVDVTTKIFHQWSSDLALTIQSPAGTTALLSYRRGNPMSSSFYPVTFDDSANTLVTDYGFPGALPPLVPEGALARFIGQNPNGTWTFTVFDHFCDETSSTVEYWALDITTLDTVLTPTTVQASDATVTPIPNPGLIQSTILVSGAEPVLCDVNVTTFIEHTWSGDLEISLSSPAGTTVVLSTGNGSANDHIFNGTLWDDQASNAVSRTNGVNGQTSTPLIGEGKLAKLIGEDPNGVWTLTVEDTATHGPPNDGTLTSWALEITTCTTPGTAYCFGDGLDPVVTAQCPCSNFGAFSQGCANSASAIGGRLFATGTTSPNTILFQLRNVPNNNLATGFMNTANANPAGVVYGDGVRCQSGTLIRFGSHNTGTLGDGANTWTASPPTAPVGLTRYYQVQYRNPAPAFCPPATFNISNGYRIAW